MASVSASQTTLVSELRGIFFGSDTRSDGSAFLSTPSYREVGYPSPQPIRHDTLPSPSAPSETYTNIPMLVPGDVPYRSRDRFESASIASFDGSVDNTKQNNSKRPTAAASNKAGARDFSIGIVSVIAAMAVFFGIFIAVAYNQVLSGEFVMPSISDAVILPLLILLGIWIVISSYFLPKTHQGDEQEMKYREGPTPREQALEKQVKDLMVVVEKLQSHIDNAAKNDKKNNTKANINQGADNPGIGNVRLSPQARSIIGTNVSVFMDHAQQHNHI